MIDVTVIWEFDATHMFKTTEVLPSQRAVVDEPLPISRFRLCGLSELSLVPRDWRHKKYHTSTSPFGAGYPFFDRLQSLEPAVLRCWCMSQEICTQIGAKHSREASGVCNPKVEESLRARGQLIMPNKWRGRVGQSNLCGRNGTHSRVKYCQAALGMT